MHLGAAELHTIVDFHKVNAIWKSTTRVLEKNLVTYQNIFPPPPKKKLIFFPPPPPNFHFGGWKMQQNVDMFWSKTITEVSKHLSFLNEVQAPSRLRYSPKDCCYPRSVEHQNHLGTFFKRLNDWRSLKLWECQLVGSLSLLENQTWMKSIENAGVNTCFWWMYHIKKSNLKLGNLVFQVTKFP